MQKRILFLVINNLICLSYLMFLYFNNLVNFTFLETTIFFGIFNFFNIIYSQELYSHLITNMLKQFLICFFSSIFIGVLISDFKLSINIFLFNLLIQMIIVIIIDYILTQKKLSFLILGNTKDSLLFAKKIILQYHKFVKKIEINNNLNDIKEEDFNEFDYIVTSSEINKSLSSFYLQSSKYIIIPSIDEIVMTNLYIDKIDDLLVYKNRKIGLNRIQKVIKRIFDLLMSIFLLAILWPLFLIIAILIKLDDGGPVFYYQQRQTLDNQTFVLIKFRTMIKGAEQHTGAVFAIENDHRITRVGRILRMLRLDELPQLINIIRGDMSIVGPRPERLFFIQKFLEKEKMYGLRFNYLAGITGLSQINVNYDSSFIEKLKFDLLYIFKYSLFLDVKIIFNTILVLINPVSTKGIIKENKILDLLVKNSLQARIINQNLVLDNIGK